MILYTGCWINYSVSNMHPFDSLDGSVLLTNCSNLPYLWFEIVCTIAVMKLELSHVMKLELSHQCTLIFYMNGACSIGTLM